MPGEKAPPANMAAIESPEKDATLEFRLRPGVTEDRAIAESVVAGVVGNALTVGNYSSGSFGALSLMDCATVLLETIEATKRGDLSAAESLLTSQAMALNAIFCELARRAALNMGERLDASERYMRLALKAQGQCRATLETLAAIKNPPVVFARQANINTGGQQQVNNALGPLPCANLVQSSVNRAPGEN